VINKIQININITACYFTETTVTNKNSYFTSLAVMLTLCELNGTGDPWWWKSQRKITKICSRCKSASLL